MIGNNAWYEDAGLEDILLTAPPGCGKTHHLAHYIHGLIAGKVGSDLAPNLTLTAGLRMLDGGGDNDEVYNFARFYYGVASVIYRF